MAFTSLASSSPVFCIATSMISSRPGYRLPVAFTTSKSACLFTRIFNVKPCNGYAAACRFDESGQHGKNGGFAGSVGSDHAEDLSFMYVKAYMVYRHYFPFPCQENLGKIPDFNDGVQLVQAPFYPSTFNTNICSFDNSFFIFSCIFANSLSRVDNQDGCLPSPCRQFKRYI